MRQIFLINLGSTSFKFKLYDEQKGTFDCTASGEIESIGAARSPYRVRRSRQDFAGTASCPKHEDAFSLCMELLAGAAEPLRLSDIDAISYKAVHGGSLHGTRYVDGELLAEMERVCALAPAHNPIYIRLMRAIWQKYPDVPQIARFETSFHATIPEYRALYGVPYEWAEEYGIRRYGFHGSSHEYIAGRMRELEPAARRVVSLHLGGSSSACAILDGESIASSMGATPQSGLFQNNRVGDFDCFCLRVLLEHMSMEETYAALSSQSGLLGVSGVSNDMREIIDAAQGGNVRAGLALDAYCDGIIGYVGMFTAYLQGLDALVFTGGIGMGSALIRARVCTGLRYLGVHLAECDGRQGDRLISVADSPVRVYVLHTDEELTLARCTVALLSCES